MIELGPEDTSEPSPGFSFMQSGFWADFKGLGGWSSQRYSFIWKDESGSQQARGRVQVLLRQLGGPFSFAYVPAGPIVDLPSPSRGPLLRELALALRPRFPHLCLFIRFDPPWFEEGRIPFPSFEHVDRDSPEKKPASDASIDRPRFTPWLRKAIGDVQPPDSVILALGPTEGELLASMKPKWRYNIKLSEKKGIVVTSEGPDSLSAFYELYEKTSRRDRIAIHPLSYYTGLFECARAQKGGIQPDLRLWFARHEGEALASIITLFHGNRATYLYGASADEKRSFMPAYALQWAAIRAAKVTGCVEYDFYGVPPTDNPGHPMAGLRRFKTGFGGRVVHYAGSWDLPFYPIMYKAWRTAEGTRNWWYKVALKAIGRAGTA